MNKTFCVPPPDPAQDPSRQPALCIPLSANGQQPAFDTLRDIAEAASALGVTRIILTGDEPLACPDIPLLVMMLTSVAAPQDMAMITEGLLLPRWAKALRGAGLRRLIIRLDTFDPDKYRALHGGRPLSAALTGIRAAMEVGFPPVTLQTRLISGINDDELPSLARLTQSAGISLRLIELTELEAQALPLGKALSCEEALRRLPALEPHGPDTYRLPGASGIIALAPCSRRRNGCLLLEAGGMLRLGGRTADLRGLRGDALRSAMGDLLS